MRAIHNWNGCTEINDMLITIIVFLIHNMKFQNINYPLISVNHVVNGYRTHLKQCVRNLTCIIGTNENKRSLRYI